MRACTRKNPLLTSAFAFAGALIFLTCCSQSRPNPPRKDNPSDKVEIIGTFPEGVAIKLAAVYQTTVMSSTCAPMPTWLDAVASPKVIVVPVHLDSRVKAQGIWTAWRDLILPGECGWRLRGIEYRVDRSAADFQSHEKMLIANFITDTCGLDVHHTECPAGSININDDASVPIHHFCKFSVIPEMNACIFEADGRAGGPRLPFKYLHILRTQQHVVRFTLTDLES